MIDLSTYLHDRLDRHTGILSDREQRALSEAVICGAGAGGVGGWTYLALARLGCRRFRVADPGTFEPSNANRQAGCDSRTIGANKAEVVARELRHIDPEIAVDVFPEGLTEENVERFVAGGSIVVDGVDLYALEIKKRLFDAARRQGLAVVSAPILGYGAALCVFHPTRSPSFADYFGEIPSREDKAAYRRYTKMLAAGLFGFKPRLDDWPAFTGRVDAGRAPSVGTSCLLSASLNALAILDQILDRGRFPVVPETVHIDLMEQRVRRTGRLRRRLFRWLVGRHLRRLETGDGGIEGADRPRTVPAE